MKNQRYLFVLIIISIVFITCKKDIIIDEPATETGHITFAFTHYIDGQPLQTDTMKYINAAGNLYQVNDLMYFISDVTFNKSNGSKKIIDEWKDINYIDINIPSTLTWNVYDDIPVGTYDSITFTFGISAEKNKSFMFVNPPEVNMCWPEVLGGGYHYLMINGKWKDSVDFVRNYNFHLGIGQLYKSNTINCVDSIYAFVQNYFTVNIPNSSFTVEKDKTLSIEIIMNVDSWFETPHIYDHNYWGGDVMQNQPAMQMANENGFDVFTIGIIQ